MKIRNQHKEHINIALIVGLFVFVVGTIGSHGIHVLYVGFNVR
jgi:preprotein translocase subunit Sss1